MRLGTFFIVGSAAILALSHLSGCADPRIAGVVNGKEIITSAPIDAQRPHLRDTVRKDDIVCGDEPFGPLTTQKQINQNIKNKITWGRQCKAKAEIGWKVIEQEP